MSTTITFNSDAPVKALRRGFIRDRSSRILVCAFCGASFERGIAHEADGRQVSARRAAEAHVAQEHGGVFPALLALGKGTTGLTETQEAFLLAAYSGADDAAIAAKLGGISTSAVRNHRFQLRRRLIEAKILLALGGLLEGRQSVGSRFVAFGPTMPVHDGRTVVTEDEAADIEAKFFEPDGVRLKRFPPKEKQRLVVLARIAGKFERGAVFTEAETNAILKQVWDDHATLRRALVDYRFLERKPDGSEYRRP